MGRANTFLEAIMQIRLLDFIFITAFIVVGVVLYWVVKYGDQATEEFRKKWK